MDDKLQDELLAKYGGKKVKKECTDWKDLQEENLLTEHSTTDDGALDITINMEIQIELDDEEEHISDIYITFHTSCWGDWGIGEEDPEDYWTYAECYKAAEDFIKNILEQP